MHNSFNTKQEKGAINGSNALLINKSPALIQIRKK